MYQNTEVHVVALNIKWNEQKKEIAKSRVWFLLLFTSRIVLVRPFCILWAVTVIFGDFEKWRTRFMGLKVVHSKSIIYDFDGRRMQQQQQQQLIVEYWCRHHPHTTNNNNNKTNPR